MKKSMLMLAVCATVAISVFLTGCPNSAGGGGGGAGGSGDGTVHIASSGLSDFLSGVLGGLSTSSAPSGGTPDTFVIKGGDISAKKDFDVMVQAGLAGKNVIIDAPTKDQLKALAATLESHLNGNESLRAQYNGAGYNPLEFLAAQFDDLSGSEKAYEAIGLRGRQIYYVHCFDEEPDEKQKDSEPENTSANIRSAGAPENIRAASRAASDDDIKTFAAQKFAEWISKVNDENFNACYMSSKDMAGFRAVGDVPDINNLVQAQKFYHTWYPTSSGHFSDRKEALEVVIDVWPACDMDEQNDYFMVHHQSNANNDQLGYESNDDYDGPYMYWLALLSNIDKDHQTNRDLSPTTTTGSSSFTTGSTVNLNGSVGLSATGPSVNISPGGSWSKSSTTNIPDISIEQKEDDNWPSFTFNGPKGKDRDYKPKDIQKKRASFDTYSVFVLPSSFSYPKYNQVQLTSRSGISIRYHDMDEGKFWSYKTWISFHDKVIKPSNAKKNYIMNFKAPDNYTTEEIAVLQAAVQTFNEFWGANVPYLAVGADKLDSVATDYFASAMDVVTKNKNVLQDSGFKGKFTFYIQDPSAGTQLKTQDVEF